jgi:hypothetical protein
MLAEVDMAQQPSERKELIRHEDYHVVFHEKMTNKRGVDMTASQLPAQKRHLRN